MNECRNIPAPTYAPASSRDPLSVRSTATSRWNKHACRGRGVTTCTGTRADGSPCRAHSLAGQSFCFTHHPDRAAERRLAREAGGRARAARVLPSDVDVRGLRSAGDVATFLSEAIRYVIHGELDPKVANSAGYLASVLLRAIEVSVLEERIKRLEAAVQPGTVTGALSLEPEPGDDVAARLLEGEVA